MTDETRVLAEAQAVGPWQWLHDNGFTWDDVNAAAAFLDAGGYSIVPTATLERARRIEEAARDAVKTADPDDDYEGHFIEYLVDADAVDALRAALSDGGES